MMKVVSFAFNSFLCALAVSFTLFGSEWLEMRVNMGYVLVGCWVLFYVAMWFVCGKKAFRPGFAFSLFSSIIFIVYGIVVLGPERLFVVPAAIMREGLGATRIPFYIVNTFLVTSMVLFLLVAFLFDRNGRRIHSLRDNTAYLWGVKLHQRLSFSPIFNKVHTKGGLTEAVFMPGCSVSGYSPKLVVKAFDYLNRGLNNTALYTGCCGKPAKLIDGGSQFKKSRQKMIDTLKPLNCRIIVCCQSCYEVLFESGLPVIFLWEYFVKNGIPENDLADSFRDITLKLPCRASKETAGTIIELVNKKNYNIRQVYDKCCSGGCADIKDKDTISCCGECRNNLAGNSHHAYHLLDILFGNGDVNTKKRSTFATWKNRITLIFSLTSLKSTILKEK